MWFLHISSVASLFLFTDTAATEFYTLSLHDALPISSSPVAATRASCCRSRRCCPWSRGPRSSPATWSRAFGGNTRDHRSEEHTSELQSRPHLVCRLLLEKKKKDRCPELPPDKLHLHD